MKMTVSSTEKMYSFTYFFVTESLITDLQIRRGNEDNSKIIFLISQRIHML